MSQAVFGAGIMWGTQLQDSTGAAVANATPIMIGILQNVSVDISFETKELHGSDSQFAKYVGRGKGKIDCKASMGTIKGAIFNSLFFGQGQTSGINSVVYDTVGAAIPATPYQITVTPPSSGTFQTDLGVVYQATGLPLTKVASAPTTGQYSVSNAGIYTFAAADTLLVVYINYSYTATSTTAVKNTVKNIPMGYSPSFSTELYMPYDGKSLVLTLNKCISNKLSISTKLDDFMMPELDFSAFADSAGNVMSWATTE
jgi:hypothetical protein